MKQDTKWRLRDSEGKEYIIIDTEKVDIQEELNKVITKQMKEIKILKEDYMMLQNASDEVEEELQQRIDKAIEYIEKWQSFPHTNGTTHEGLRNLKDILKGSDKE